MQSFPPALASLALALALGLAGASLPAGALAAGAARPEQAAPGQARPEQAKNEHIKRVEQDIFRTYKPKMKKLTYSQGKLLIKLIDRECHSSSYEMIKAFMGPLRAGFWQVFAWGFGASLKKEYDPNGVDRLTERVVLMVEAGQI